MNKENGQCLNKSCKQKNFYISWWNNFLAIIYSYLSEAVLFLLYLSMSKLNIIILRSMEFPFASISSCPNDVDINIGICFSTKFRSCVYVDLIHQHYKKKKTWDYPCSLHKILKCPHQNFARKLWFLSLQVATAIHEFVSSRFKYFNSLHKNMKTPSLRKPHYSEHCYALLFHKVFLCNLSGVHQTISIHHLK